MARQRHAADHPSPSSRGSGRMRPDHSPGHPQRQKTCEVASGRRDRAGFRPRWGSCWPPARACGNSPAATKFATGGIFWPRPSLSGPCWDHPERVAEACEVQGEQQAAITLAVIYQRADQLNSAGGYLRCLTDRAGDGKSSAWPMILASLLRPNSMPKRRPRRPMGRRMMAIGGKGGSRVSETLVPSLRRNHDAGSMCEPAYRPFPLAQPVMQAKPVAYSSPTRPSNASSSASTIAWPSACAVSPIWASFLLRAAVASSNPHPSGSHWPDRSPIAQNRPGCQ